MRRSLTVIAVGVSLLTAVPVVAMNMAGIDTAARSLEPAARLSTATDVVSIYNSGPLKTSVAQQAVAAARDAGATAAIGRSASTGMRRVLRGPSVVQQAPSGYAYPMGTTIFPKALIGQLMGFDISGVLSATDIVMSRRTADLRGAKKGDVVELTASSGAVLPFTIAAVVDDEITGGTELLLSEEAGDRLGVSRESRVVVWGFESREALNAALAANGLISTSVRVRRGWDPPDPDGTLGMAQTKEALGEFAYRVNSNGSLSIEDAWRSANITGGSIGQLRLGSGCHRTVRVALQNAMNEVIASGLEYSINYFHANTAGGCYNPRFNRLTPDSSIGFLSRHTWGMAVDTNTVGSCQGCAPPDMDCRTVRIFRKHGFAWGGNFLRPDGMHFEWVGERRDTMLYPSRFCSNISVAALTAADGETQRATLFADDGLFVGD